MLYSALLALWLSRLSEEQFPPVETHTPEAINRILWEIVSFSRL